MTRVDNSTRAHSFPTSPPPLAKLVCNVNIVHRAASMLYCTTVQLYSTVPNICIKGGGTELLYCSPLLSSRCL